MHLNNGLDAATLAAASVAANHADEVDRTSRFPEETIRALQAGRLMSLLVPQESGGTGAGLSQVASVCHALAQACGASGMIYAMHQIQLACVVAHGRGAEWHNALLRRISEEQWLLASVTSEIGTGGNIHKSLCAVEGADGAAHLEKDAPTISYGARADGLLITARSSTDAAPNDQVMVVALKRDYTLTQTSQWDALGMRGTCSEGFGVCFHGMRHQILPAPFADIAGQTMLPVSHLLWASVWLGIATDAINRARNYLRRQGRGRDNVPMLARRLARGVALLQMIQARLSQSLREYDTIFARDSCRLPPGFTADVNNLKTAVSELCIEAVQHAFMVCGIDGYKNGSEFSLGRHIRDLMSAPIMINNDRMLESTGNLLMMQRPSLGVL